MPWEPNQTYEAELSVKLILDLTLFFPMFPFDPPENIRKPKGTLGRKGLKSVTISAKRYILGA